MKKCVFVLFVVLFSGAYSAEKLMVMLNEKFEVWTGSAWKNDKLIEYNRDTTGHLVTIRSTYYSDNTSSVVTCSRTEDPYSYTYRYGNYWEGYHVSGYTEHNHLLDEKSRPMLYSRTGWNNDPYGTTYFEYSVTSVYENDKIVKKTERDDEGWGLTESVTEYFYDESGRLFYETKNGYGGNFFTNWEYIHERRAIGIISDPDSVIVGKHERAYNVNGDEYTTVTYSYNPDNQQYILKDKHTVNWTYDSYIPDAGDGTEESPYQISRPDNLIWLSGNPGLWSYFYVQTADIDISSIDKGTGWSPIGNTTDKFTGSFDGQGHTIDGLYINRPAESGIGFFGRTLNAEIKNINLTNVNVVGSASTGGLAGYIETTVVSECSVTGSVTGANNTGGLIGMSLTSSEIRSCSSISTVTGTKYAGGLCGYNTTNSLISNSFSLGDVNGSDFAGGFLGYNNNSAIVNNCYSAGSVSGAGTKGGFAAGNVNESEVNGSFWDLNTSGQSESAGGTGKTTAEMQTMTTYTDAGWDFVGESVNGNEDIWVINELNNYGYPYIASLPVGIENNEAETSNFELYQNYPNPFNPVTAINYALPKAAQVELNVYNLQGQLVQSLVNAKQPKGTHKAEFNASDLTSGLYIYNLKVDGKTVQSRKMMMLK
jgi:hypothetical protein